MRQVRCVKVLVREEVRCVREKVREEVATMFT